MRNDVPKVKDGRIPRTALQANQEGESDVVALTTQARHQKIAESAYFRAQERGFARGQELEDWLAAEHEIDDLLIAKTRRSSEGMREGPLGTRLLKRLRQQLLDRQKTLLEEIREQRAQSESHPFEELAGTVADSGDAAMADVLLDTEHALVGKHIDELRDIEAALERMDAGTYGDCVDCEQAIGADRLEIYPTAKRCVLCQSRRERTSRSAPTPGL